MRDGLVLLDTFLTEIEAKIAQGRLESLGVHTEIQADNCGGMRPHFDLTQGVRLLVDQVDLTKAREIMQQAADEPEGNPWQCPACGEQVEGNFDACWNCHRARE